MQYASPETIAKIRAELESEKKRFLDYKPNLDGLHDARNLARIAQWITVIQSSLEYIDQGMDPIEFLKRCLQFCADDRSHPEAVKLRASYTIYLLGLENDD